MKKLTFVGRNFKLTQQKSKKQFQALDGTLKMRDPKTDQDVVQNHRCSDLDKLVPELLGVSSAIVDHVLFCHQEVGVLCVLLMSF
jgi:DNA repair protein RAD50